MSSFLMMHQPRVVVEQAWWHGGWNVHIADIVPGKTVYYYWNGTAWQADATTEGQRPAKERPSLTLPGDVLPLLVKAAQKELPADGAMADHLRDAQAVRDRLLTLVEAGRLH